MNHSMLVAAAIAALIAATPVFGQSPATPEIRRNVDYVNGGISEEDAENLRGRAASFPLEITFARRTETGYGFVADVRVRIIDAAGAVVLSLPSADPILLANLPAGRYTVEATLDGQTKRQQVALGRGHRKVGFTW